MPLGPALFSALRADWETPTAFFDHLDAEYHFTLDVCASAANAKCDRYFTEVTNGLAQCWATETCWCNPPYGRTITAWLEKAESEARNGATVVMLLPARTDTRWFQRYALSATEIRFVPGRLTFMGAPAPAPFPSVLVIWRPHGAIAALRRGGVSWK